MQSGSDMSESDLDRFMLACSDLNQPAKSRLFQNRPGLKDINVERRPAAPAAAFQPSQRATDWSRLELGDAFSQATPPPPIQQPPLQADGGAWGEFAEFQSCPPPQPTVSAYAPVPPQPILSAFTPIQAQPAVNSHTPVSAVPAVNSHTPVSAVPAVNSHTPVSAVPAVSEHTPAPPQPIVSAHTMVLPQPTVSAHTPVPPPAVSAHTPVPPQPTVSPHTPVPPQPTVSPRTPVPPQPVVSAHTPISAIPAAKPTRFREGLVPLPAEEPPPALWSTPGDQEEFGEFVSAAAAGRRGSLPSLELQLAPAAEAGGEVCPLEPDRRDRYDRYDSFRQEIMSRPPSEPALVAEWRRCLQACYQLLQEGAALFGSVADQYTCSEVAGSPQAAQYVENLSRVFRVAGRIEHAAQLHGCRRQLEFVLSETCKAWANLSAFVANSPTRTGGADPAPAAEAAAAPGEPSCGICLLPATSADSEPALACAGRRYHACCANLWLNRVADVLPALEA